MSDQNSPAHDVDVPSGDVDVQLLLSSLSTKKIIELVIGNVAARAMWLSEGEEYSDICSCLDQALVAASTKPNKIELALQSNEQ